MEKEHHLHAMAKLGDPVMVREALKRHQATERDVYGETALHWASNVEVAKILVSAGGSVSMVDPNGDTPLHWACENGNMALVQFYIENGADVNQVNRRKDSPLHAAAACGDTEVVRLLLEAQADAKAVNAALESPVHIASRGGEVAILKALVKAGAKVKAASADGSTPMHEACKIPKGLQVVKYLIQRGCDVNVLTNTGRSPLQVAFKKRCKDIVEELCEKGADVGQIAKEAAVRGHGWTALHLAAEIGSLKLCQGVVKKGASFFDAEAKAQGMTPADVARKSVYANEKVVKFLDEQIRLKKLAAGEGQRVRRSGKEGQGEGEARGGRGSSSLSRGNSTVGSKAGSQAGSRAGSVAGSAAGSRIGSRAGSQAPSAAGSRAGSRSGSRAGSRQASARGSPDDDRGSVSSARRGQSESAGEEGLGSPEVSGEEGSVHSSREGIPSCRRAA